MADFLSERQPLPCNPFDEANQRCLYSAYDCCRAMEESHPNIDDDSLVYARYLGYLITELPPNGSKAVAEEVNRCKNDYEMLKELAEYLIYSLIPMFKGDQGHTLAPFYDDDDEAEQLTLKRDNYRCVLTGIIDHRSYLRMNQEQRQMYNLGPEDTRSVITYCHILSPSVDWRFGDENLQTDRSSMVWSILKSFGSPDSFRELNGPSIHGPANGISLRLDLVGLIRSLDLWFVYLPNHPLPNTYQVHSMVPIGIPLASKTVTFTSKDPSMPPPAPNFLQIHATICRVALLSGADLYLNRIEGEIEMATGLAGDGSSARLLSSRLHSLSIQRTLR